MSRADKGEPVWHLAATTGEVTGLVVNPHFPWSSGHQRMLTTLCPKNLNSPALPRIVK